MARGFCDRPRIPDASLCALFEPSECLGTFLNDNREAITAVATAVIAIFTLTLWWATRLGLPLVIAYLLACLRSAELIATHWSRNRPFGQQPLAHVLNGNEMGQRGLEQRYGRL